MTEGLKETNYTFDGQTDFYRGKVRDVYHFDNKLELLPHLLLF